MSFRNRDGESRVESRESRDVDCGLGIGDCGLKSEVRNLKSEIRRAPRSRLRAPRGARRGVLLLVVLSLLVLFMLIGTAFMMSSNQYRTASQASAKLNRVGSPPTKLLDRALMQVLRDTGNPNSAIRYHSLLRDLDGSEGFQAVIYSPTTVNLGNTAGQATRFAGATRCRPEQR